MYGKTLNLPPEIFTFILRNLQLSDLHRCLLVNSAFYDLVQPFLCRSILFDYEGITYPETKYYKTFHGALPFKLETADLSQPVSMGLTQRAFERVEVLYHDHWDSDRECCFSRGITPRIDSCRVLSICLGIPGDNWGLASAHMYPELNNYAYDLPPLSHPSDCYLLQTVLGNATVDKLVLRDVPVAHAGVDPDLLSLATFQSVREVVIVFDGSSLSEKKLDEIWKWQDRYTCQDDPVPCYALDEYIVFELDAMFPPNAKDFTFVFWTDEPATEFSTFCCTARHHIKAKDDRKPPRCDCPPSSPFHDDYDFDTHESCWENELIRQVSVAISARSRWCAIQNITIVNASAIVPDGSNRENALFPISKGLAKHDTFELRFRKALQAHLLLRVSPDETERVMDRVEFKYMKDWLSTSAWEDVFSPKEVKPWMDFKRHAQITDWFKPESPDDVKWRKEVDGRERVKLIHRRISARRLKPSKNSWRH